MPVDKEKNLVVGVDGGQKYDHDKPRWDLLPFDAVEQVVKIMTFGAKKYEEDNWKLVEPQRYIGALMRHLTAHLKGEVLDQDSGFSHLAHMACNAIFMLWHQLNGRI